MRSAFTRVLQIFGVLATAALSVGMLFTLPFGPATPVAADVSDFSYDSWHVDYEVGVDESGRSITHVTETLVARFPDFDQNRGIVRGLPEEYEGVSTDPRDFTVTDEHGQPVPFETEEDDGFVAVLTGDDEYVHGRQTYVIEYTLSDTILAREDGKADEFYWDLVDFEHDQTIDNFSADIEFSPALADRLDGNMTCYAGYAKVSDTCTVTRNGTSFQIAPIQLSERQGATIAIGLESGSVVQPSQRLPNFALDGLPLFIGGAGLLVGLVGTISGVRLKRKRSKGRGTVIAQYDAPSALPPLIAAPLAGSSQGVVSSEIVHLAVSGAIRIEDGEPEQGVFGSKKPQPVLRVVDPARAVDSLDKMALSSIFSTAEPGQAFEVPKKSESFGKKMSALKSAGLTEASSRGYFTKEHSRVGRILGFVSLGLLAVLAVFVVLSLMFRGGSATAVICIAGASVLVMLAISALTKHRVHTPEGAEAREYLEGVKLFISVAEQQRIQMLQSYEGAERKSDGTVNVVELYERLLPYAMIFGLEKQWVQVLEVTYQQHGGYVPMWYPGAAMHGMGSVGSTIESFTSSMSSSVSYTSSSSGGSSGGGFAGGGGGGGFSGGR